MSNRSRKERRKFINESKSIARQSNPLPGNSLVVSQQIVTWRSGPIPSHEELAGYDAVVPGAANRILLMAEQQTSHRIGLENKVIRHDIIKSYMGLTFGLIVCLTGFYAAYKIAELGYPVTGALFGAAPLAGLVGVFIKATNLRQKERDRMRQQQDRQTR